MAAVEPDKTHETTVLGPSSEAAAGIYIDITGMDAAQTATDLQTFLEELEARVTAVE